MNTRTLLSVALAFGLVAGCAECAGPADDARTRVPPPAPEPIRRATYEVHEWGLVRGTASDRVMLSGTHAAAPPALPMAKPVLYFHRDGEGPLTVRSTVTIPRGRIVEHWPPTLGTSAEIAWPELRIETSSCRGARYPSTAEPPCAGLADGCEAAELALVETEEAACLRDANGDRWNHLFYRAEVTGTPELPLAIEPLPDGRLRVTNRGSTPLVGQLLRLGHPAGGAGSDQALIVAPPAPGASVELEPPSGSVAAAAESLLRTLQSAGLTEAEARAFRRAWDETLFSAESLAAAAGETIPTASPMRGSWTSVVYVLPESTADALATLRFEPAPRRVRRVIVAWIDEARAPR